MIEVAHASYAYPAGGRALDDVSLYVSPGERVVLLGLNGSGKSTLARLVNGALVPSSGIVSVDGVVSRPGASHELARLVGYVRQDPRNQIVSPLVSDEIAFGPRNLGLARDEVLERVDEALEACGIPDLRNRMTDELSGGQQQLVSLAGALAMRPRYLVLDEVCSQLDEASRQRIAEVVAGLVRTGTGVLEIAHGPEALFGAARAVVLSGGRVAWEGAPRDLLLDEAALALSGLSADPLARLLARAMAEGCALGERPDPAALATHLDPEESTPPESARPRPSQAHALTLEGARVCYGTNAALDDVTLEARGVALVLGPSGSGKTTAARVLASVQATSAGGAALDGREVVAGEVGLAFQRPEDQLFADTVLDDVAYGLLARGVPRGRADAAARAVASRMGLDEDLLDRSPFELSGGQMRRAALAGVVAPAPDAYVFDEPTAGLDAPSRRALRALVRELADEGAAVVVITHDAAEWLDAADDVVFLRGGRVVSRHVAAGVAALPEAFRAAGLEPPLMVRVRALMRGRDAGTDGSSRPTAPAGSSRRTRADEVVTGDDPSSIPRPASPRSRRIPSRTPLGAYVPGDTIAHRLDARVKVAMLVAASIASFGASSVAGLAVVTAGLAVALVASRTSPLQVLRGLRPAAVVLAVSLLANALVLVGQPGLSLAGLVRGVAAVVRIALVVGFALVFSATTMSPAVADALDSLMAPLRRLGVPVGEASTVVSVALRFIPLAEEEVGRIRCAQAARGARLDEGGVVSRVRGWGQVLVPLIVGLFRRADELGRAMEDRCYTGGRVVELAPLTSRDWTVLLGTLVWAAVALWVAAL